ncbi:MAG: acyl-CoA thioesterase [Chloroflexi bacterium]|nr:acyl-CoA thioesterase [Chloroflexota bacterium]MCL5952356.1 acyl-CoA thioesterase [Chloroflexota bacterium]
MSVQTNERVEAGVDVRGGDPKFSAKCASDSQVTLSQQMMPSDANPLGNVHGGYIMKLVDEAGGLAGMRHARRPVVTVAVDSISFLSPVKVGHLLTLRASVNWVGKSSIEVGIRVEAENPITGEITHTNSAFAVYVALDDSGRPTSVPPLILSNEEERRRWDEAEGRQQLRLARWRKKPVKMDMA